MASTREVARLLAAAERSQVKVIAIGDRGQLPSVQAGGWLGSLGRRFGIHRLRAVMRQRDPDERRLLERVHDGEPDLYLRHKQAAGLLQVFEGNDSGAAAEQAAVTAWHAQQARRPNGQAILICRDNERRHRLNAAARTVLARERQLGPTLTCGEREFAIGDRTICRRNAPALNVDNGTRGTVTAVDRQARTVRLRTDTGAERLLPARYCAQQLELAYALTAHGAQGATVEWAGVIGAPADFTRNWSYTALSRSREPTEVFVVQEPQHHMSERNEVGRDVSGDGRDGFGELRLRMSRRDDEDLALDISRERPVDSSICQRLYLPSLACREPTQPPNRGRTERRLPPLDLLSLELMQLLMATMAGDPADFANRHRATFPDMSEGELEELRQRMLRQLADGEIVHKDPGAQAMRMLMSASGNVAQEIYWCQWSVLTSQSKSFVTSDRGLSMFDPSPRFPWSGNAWLSSPDAQTLIPLSAHVCLLVTPGDPTAEWKEVTDDDVLRINSRTYGWAERFVFGSNQETVTNVRRAAKHRPELVARPLPFRQTILLESVAGDDELAREHERRGWARYLGQRDSSGQVTLCDYIVVGEDGAAVEAGVRATAIAKRRALAPSTGPVEPV